MKPQPTITMREFFELPEVKECQEVCKRNRYGSDAHHAAYLRLCKLAEQYGAQEFIQAQNY